MWIRAILVAVLVCLLILHFVKWLQNQKKYPPGPPLYLVAAKFMQSGFKVHPEMLTEYAKEYGSIYTILSQPEPVVIVSGYQAIKEVLIKYSDQFSARMLTPCLKTLALEKGIVFSKGYTWKQQRKFGVVTLRKLGMGQKALQKQIEDLAFLLAETFARENGQPFDPSIPIIAAVSNVIYALVYGQRFSVDDEYFQEILDALEYIVKFPSSFFHLLFEIAPWLMKHIEWPYRKAHASVDIVFTQARKEIEAHREQLAAHDPRDFVDHYLLQIEKSKNDPSSTYDEDNLVHCIADFLFAGTDTISATLRWGLLLLALYPDIQEKAQKEMDDAFGSSQSISFEDKMDVPYTLAVINEIQRFKRAILASNPRQSVEDVTVLGCFIPKDSIIIPDVHSVLFDPKIWETPQKFNPNHFLDKDGTFVDREELLIFGAGARDCMGKNLAKMELFYFFTILLKAFTFKLPEGVTEVNLEPVGGVLLYPQLYEIRAVPRVH
ncbi:cytochrome P450 2J2-like [Heteronotia binoei]|uniref:cytochrome P450 2J2-like n=1 Tax=Heteronotia binoei TaxID=13085 RepID=UPI0029306D12|nr:cytochrome P450 2J2-like [Heteronotia binoei]